jgi:non-canonical poly(A) RNA polymerase PAPD5/7
MSLSGPSSSQLDSKDEIRTRRKYREDRDQGTVDAAAGPSNVAAAAATKPKRKGKGKGSGTATPIPQGEPKSPVAFEEPSFENNGDFIAFGSIDDDHRKEEKEDTRVRDWDKGKGKVKVGERDGGGGKRSKADTDRNDWYNNKKGRTDAASRKAPWANNVDWEGSANVAELYAFFLRNPGERGSLRER